MGEKEREGGVGRNGNGSHTGTTDFTERQMRSRTVFAMRISIGFIFAVTILMAVANAFICSKVLGCSYSPASSGAAGWNGGENIQ